MLIMKSNVSVLSELKLYRAKGPKGDTLEILSTGKSEALELLRNMINDIQVNGTIENYQISLVCPKGHLKDTFCSKNCF